MKERAREIALGLDGGPTLVHHQALNKSQPPIKLIFWPGMDVE
jgi:hypothetical protein